MRRKLILLLSSILLLAELSVKAQDWPNPQRYQTANAQLKDGVHPNREGYLVMEGIIQPILKKML